MLPRIVVLIVILLSFVGLSSNLHAETPVYGVLTNTPDTPYWQAVQLGLREGATAEHVEYYAQTLNNGETAYALEMCNSMLDRRPNILLVAIPDIDMLPACFEKAQRLNIPVIGLADTASQFENENVSSFVLADSTEAAAMGASYIAMTLGNNAQGVVIISDTSDKLAVASFTEKLQESAPALEVFIASPEELVNVAPDIRAIISVDNTATLSAVSELMASDTDLLVVSVDNKADNPTLLEKGKIHASITPLPYLLGKKAMEHASRTIEASGNNDAIYIKPVLLTKKMLDEGSDPMLQFIK